MRHARLDGRARVEYLDQQFANDTILRDEVERLLSALDRCGGFLEPESRAARQSTNTRIGPYVILEQAGHGGMGVMYHAVRDDDYRQEVAVETRPRPHRYRFPDTPVSHGAAGVGIAESSQHRAPARRRHNPGRVAVSGHGMGERPTGHRVLPGERSRRAGKAKSISRDQRCGGARTPKARCASRLEAHP